MGTRKGKKKLKTLHPKAGVPLFRELDELETRVDRRTPDFIDAVLPGASGYQKHLLRRHLR